MRDNNRGCVTRIRNKKETKSFRTSPEVIKRTSNARSLTSVSTSDPDTQRALPLMSKQEVLKAGMLMDTKMYMYPEKTPSAASGISFLCQEQESVGCCVCRESSGVRWQVAMPSARRRGQPPPHIPVARCHRRRGHLPSNCSSAIQHFSVLLQIQTIFIPYSLPVLHNLSPHRVTKNLGFLCSVYTIIILINFSSNSSTTISMFALLSTLTLALLGSAAAQFTITSPTSEIFWVSIVVLGLSLEVVINLLIKIDFLLLFRSYFVHVSSYLFCYPPDL